MQVGTEFEVAWMWEASQPGLSDSDVKWQHFPHDHLRLLEEKFRAGNHDPFPIEVQHKGSPKTIEINLGKGTQHCPQTDCTRKIMRIAILHKGMEGETTGMKRDREEVE